jgi:ABC-type transport system involved in multi-copper enzyme maturation permease subunit
MAGVLDFLKWISPIHYFIPNQIVVAGIDGRNVLICLGVMAVCAAVAYPVYQKKDFAV